MLKAQGSLLLVQVGVLGWAVHAASERLKGLPDQGGAWWV